WGAVAVVPLLPGGGSRGFSAAAGSGEEDDPDWSRTEELKMSEPLRAQLEDCLQRLDIQTTCVDHPPVFTVEEMMPHLQGVGGAVTKNLFLKDKKKKSLWLVSARHDHQVNLNDLAKKGVLAVVGQGSASALALLFDQDQSVRLVLDRDLVEGGHNMVYFHPMTNTATMGLRPHDLLRFLKETGHEPILESFE
ncbi:hypothetical protein INR49_010245, partial [Caranx melampygus]